MLTEEKITELRKKVKSGVPEGEIKNQLLAEGYTNEDIKKVFEPTRRDMSSWYFISAFIVLLIAFWLSAKGDGLYFLPFILSGLLFYEYFKTVTNKKKKAED